MINLTHIKTFLLLLQIKTQKNYIIEIVNLFIYRKKNKSLSNYRKNIYDFIDEVDIY